MKMFLDEKMKKTLKKPQFGNVGASNLKFYSVVLKFGPQVQKEF
jgi:hypothetical protein